MEMRTERSPETKRRIVAGGAMRFDALA